VHKRSKSLSQQMICATLCAAASLLLLLVMVA
jgi:hypothetical protein